MFYLKMKCAAWVLTTMSLVGVGIGIGTRQLQAEENAVSKAPVDKVKGPLAALPSKPGEHLDKIKTLGDNTWLNLGKPAPDPKFGTAIGRAWSRKMAFAPDLRGAFLYGSGVHCGSTVRNGKLYYNDDLYFYDINAHAWVCAYPGTPLSHGHPGLKVDPEIGMKLDPATGLNVDKDGNIMPISPSAHGYWTSDYDTDRRQFLFVPVGDAGFGFSPNGVAPSIHSREHSPYYYDIRTGKFDRRKSNPFGWANFDSALFYSPKQKTAVYIGRGTWQYDVTGNVWTKVSEDGGGNGAFCYDSKRDQIYFVTGPAKKNEKNEWVPAGPNTTTVYDIATRVWTKVVTSGDPGVSAASHTAFISYDTANDVVGLYVGDKHHVYDPNTKTWTALPTAFPGGKVNWNASSGFYDPELNAFFYFNAGDSIAEPGNMWVYRYKAADKQKNTK